MILLFTIIVVLLTQYSNAGSSVSEYSAKCQAISEDNESINLDCTVALFSRGSFHLSGKLVVLSHDLCDHLSEVRGKYTDSIVAVKRGQCAFDQKAANANLLKFKALIIVNSEDSFPMGAADVEYVSVIPVLMIRSHEVLQQSSVQISLSFG